MGSVEEVKVDTPGDHGDGWISLLASNRYEQVTNRVKEAYRQAEANGEVEQAALLAAAHHLCASCIEIQNEVKFHKQAYQHSEQRREKLVAELQKLLQLIGNVSEAPVPDLADSQKNLLNLSAARTPETKKNNSLWQRLIVCIKQRLFKESSVSESLIDRVGAGSVVVETASELTSSLDLRKLPPEAEDLPGKNGNSLPPAKEQSNEAVSKADGHPTLEVEGKIGVIETAVPKLVVYCLGQFQVYQDDQQIINWPSGKGKAVFKYIVASHDRPVPRDILMNTFWPNADFEAARNNLNVSIYGLRQAFRANRPDFDHIVFQNDHYQLNPEMNTWIDVEEFERYYQVGQRLERDGLLDKSIEQYEKAKKLYNGDFLEEDLYENWPILQREGLNDTYLIILDRLTRYYYQHKQYLICIQLCQKMLLKDDCREDAHRRLMRCYYQQGKRTLALRQYKICKEVLAQVLDVPPMPETTRLFKRIRNGEAT